MDYLEAKKKLLKNRLKNYMKINIGIELIVYAFYVWLIITVVKSMV